MERKFKFAPEEYFHIYNRGTEKRNIFDNKKDYERFLECLYLFNSTERIVLRAVPKKERFSYDRENTIIDIGAYCLMPNHFHLLIRSKDDYGVSNFMKKLQTAYSMYFNKKYKRNGSLFQGPFKAQHVTRDEYLKYLFSYIHLNPVKLIDSDWKKEGILDVARSKNFLDSYKYSSYADYANKSNRAESNILTPTVFPEYFRSSTGFEDFIEFWLLFKDYTSKYI